MVDFEKLQKKIDDTGLSITVISTRSGILRTTLYNRFKGIGEFTASEITNLSRVLNLTNKERDDIFLRKKCN